MCNFSGQPCWENKGQQILLILRWTEWRDWSASASSEYKERKPSSWLPLCKELRWEEDSAADVLCDISRNVHTLDRLLQCLHTWGSAWLLSRLLGRAPPFAYEPQTHCVESRGEQVAVALKQQTMVKMLQHKKTSRKGSEVPPLEMPQPSSTNLHQII